MNKPSRKTLTSLFTLANSRQGINRFPARTQLALIANGWAKSYGNRSVEITDAGVRLAISLSPALTWNTVVVTCDPRSDSKLKLVTFANTADERGV